MALRIIKIEGLLIVSLKLPKLRFQRMINKYEPDNYVTN